MPIPCPAQYLRGIALSHLLHLSLVCCSCGKHIHSIEISLEPIPFYLMVNDELRVIIVLDF